MLIYIGADHRGFKLKETLKNFLKLRGYQVVDLGNTVYDEGDDNPIFAAKVAEQVNVDSETSRGILICGSGVGVSIVANKFPHIRAALASSPDQAYDSRKEDDSNILALGANYLDDETAERITLTWLETPFSGEERYRRRLSEIDQIEETRPDSDSSEKTSKDINWQ
ncbi:MAG: RpiB/LacA/LacB family sugar-phosphate isomerase [Minisyncoccia bacterium]